MMEANICDVNHLDADVLLPPRKRLLAGLKKQNLEKDPSSVASSSSTSSVFDTCLNDLLNAHVNNTEDSPEDIVKSSRSAAAAAKKAAKAARAAAEEKAAIAARAVAAAKSALDLVALFSEETANKEKYPKKNKLKKHVPVHSLYKKPKPIENWKTDEALARQLHQAINSSPRISKNPSSSDSKGHKNKKPRVLPDLGKSRDSYDNRELGGISSKSNGHGVTCEMDLEGSMNGTNAIQTVEKVSKNFRNGQSIIENGESSLSKEKFGNDVGLSGRKRGRVKLKKLPLSICTSKDQANPVDELNMRCSSSSEQNKADNLNDNHMPLFAVKPTDDSAMSYETGSNWKCQDFKPPSCVKQNKVVQS